MTQAPRTTRPALQHRAAIFSLIAACALLVSLPLFIHGPSCGHDFDFHLQSWFAANAGWHSALAAHSFAALSPHWLPAANYGAGEPRFIFYPPLSWALGAALGFLLPWTLVSQAFTYLALLGCGLAFYSLARIWVSRPVAAGAACVYLANPYLLFVAYERTAYGELLGAITMPLVMLYTLRPRPSMVRLALIMAVLWLTNAPAAVMGCYLLALCALWQSAAERGFEPAARSFAALGLGTGLAAVYVLPAWYEQRWVEIARVVGPGMRIEDSFLFGHTGEPFHDQVLHTASCISIVILGVGLVCAAGAWIALRSRSLTSQGKRSTATGARPIILCALLTTLLGAILLLLLPPSEPVWRFAPELHFLQFPWRWLLVGALAATLAGALAVESLLSKRVVPRSAIPALRRTLYTWSLAGALCLGAWYAGHFAEHAYGQYCDEEDNVQAQQALLGSADPAKALGEDASGFEGTDEYTPFNADNGEIQQGLPAVRLLLSPEDDEGDDSTNPNPAWNASRPTNGSILMLEQTPEHMRLSVTAPGPRYAVLRLLDYPAWQLRVNGRPLGPRPHREDGLLTVPVEKGTTLIEVNYRATPDVYAGRLLSLLSLGTLAILSFRRRLATRH